MKIILCKVTTRELNFAAISKSCAPYNSVQEHCNKCTHGYFLGFPNHSWVCLNLSNPLATQRSKNTYYQSPTSQALLSCDHLVTTAYAFYIFGIWRFVMIKLLLVFQTLRTPRATTCVNMLMQTSHVKVLKTTGSRYVNSSWTCSTCVLNYLKHSKYTCTYNMAPWYWAFEALLHELLMVSENCYSVCGNSVVVFAVLVSSIL